MMNLFSIHFIQIFGQLFFSGILSASNDVANRQIPASTNTGYNRFDLSRWKITKPIDKDTGKPVAPQKLAEVLLPRVEKLFAIRSNRPKRNLKYQYTSTAKEFYVFWPVVSNKESQDMLNWLIEKVYTIDASYSNPNIPQQSSLVGLEYLDAMLRKYLKVTQLKSRIKRPPGQKRISASDESKKTTFEGISALMKSPELGKLTLYESYMELVMLVAILDSYSSEYKTEFKRFKVKLYESSTNIDLVNTDILNLQSMDIEMLSDMTIKDIESINFIDAYKKLGALIMSLDSYLTTKPPLTPSQSTELHNLKNISNTLKERKGITDTTSPQTPEIVSQPDLNRAQHADKVPTKIKKLSDNPISKHETTFTDMSFGKNEDEDDVIPEPNGGTRKYDHLSVKNVESISNNESNTSHNSPSTQTDSTTHTRLRPMPTPRLDSIDKQGFLFNVKTNEIIKNKSQTQETEHDDIDDAIQVPKIYEKKPLIPVPPVTDINNSNDSVSKNGQEDSLVELKDKIHDISENKQINDNVATHSENATNQNGVTNSNNATDIVTLPNRPPIDHIDETKEKNQTTNATSPDNNDLNLKDQRVTIPEPINDQNNEKFNQTNHHRNETSHQNQPEKTSENKELEKKDEPRKKDEPSKSKNDAGTSSKTPSDTSKEYERNDDADIPGKSFADFFGGVSSSGGSDSLAETIAEKLFEIGAELAFEYYVGRALKGLKGVKLAYNVLKKAMKNPANKITKSDRVQIFNRFKKIVTESKSNKEVIRRLEKDFRKNSKPRKRNKNHDEKPEIDEDDLPDIEDILDYLEDERRKLEEEDDSEEDDYEDEEFEEEDKDNLENQHSYEGDIADPNLIIDKKNDDEKQGPPDQYIPEPSGPKINSRDNDNQDNPTSTQNNLQLDPKKPPLPIDLICPEPPPIDTELIELFSNSLGRSQLITQNNWPFLRTTLLRHKSTPLSYRRHPKPTDLHVGGMGLVKPKANVEDGIKVGTVELVGKNEVCLSWYNRSSRRVEVVKLSKGEVKMVVQ